MSRAVLTISVILLITSLVGDLAAYFLLSKSSLTPIFNAVTLLVFASALPSIREVLDLSASNRPDRFRSPFWTVVRILSPHYVWLLFLGSLGSIGSTMYRISAQ